MTSQRDSARLAIDIGGTFTDVVLEAAGERRTTKVLTTPAAPERAVLDGISEVLAAADVAAAAVELVLHGTTLATNAIIERKGARTALVTTEGFRDVVAIGYESRYDQYDVMIQKVTPLVPRHLRHTVAERVDVAGRVIRDLDEDGLRALAPTLREQNVESLAVGFLHAYANPDHEQRAGEILAELLPDVSITLSSEVCPEVREYERLTTATANAYVRPMMDAYLKRLDAGLRQLGLGCPLLMMTSGGGLTTLQTAGRQPIRLVESGPAGGAILAREIARELDLDKVISFDMGGTTAKICLIEDFAPQKAREFEVDRQARFMKGSGLPLRIPVIEMVEIGAGGGSIARVDALNRITVGPDSAGADPGPAAYGRGGEAATVTDADIALGRIDPGRFAGGKLALDTDRAKQALTAAVGAPLDLSAELAAFGVGEMIDETMANAARVHAVELGHNAADHDLIAFGGAAPLHAGRLAQKLGIHRIIVPTHAGVGSAVGFLRAPVSYEVVRSLPSSLRDLDFTRINAAMQAMSDEAHGVVAAGAPGVPIKEHRSAFMRYRGQGHEIVVDLPGHDLTAADAAALKQAYDDAYAALYKRTLPNAEIEVLTWALTASTAPPEPARAGTPPPREAPPPSAQRDLFDAETDSFRQVALYWRPDLAPGMSLAGPALIAEDETSSFVPEGFSARIGGAGHIIIERSDP